MTMNMTLDLITTTCNVVLGYRQPFDLISVHNVEDNYKMVGVAHLVAGKDWTLKLNAGVGFKCWSFIIILEFYYYAGV